MRSLWRIFGVLALLFVLVSPFGQAVYQPAYAGTKLLPEATPQVGPVRDVWSARLPPLGQREYSIETVPATHVNGVLPYREVVKVVQGDNELLIFWDQQIGNGHKPRVFRLKDVDISFIPRGDKPARPAKDGDVGRIIDFAQNPQGFTSTVVLQQYVEWIDQERKLLELAEQLAIDLAPTHVIVSRRDYTCQKPVYKVAGEEVPPGRWGETLLIVPRLWPPSYEVRLEAYCNGQTTPTWYANVRPGQFVEGQREKALVRDLTDLDPLSELCLFFYRQVPQWQPNELPRMDDTCGLYARGDKSLRATLQREGFGIRREPYGKDGQLVWAFSLNMVPDRMQRFFPNFPNDAAWVNTQSIELGGIVYTPVVFQFADGKSVLSLESAEQPRNTGWGSWGQAVMFVQGQELADNSPFSGWSHYPAVRIVQRADGQPQLQSYDWWTK